MNKRFTQNILKFLLLIAIALSLGCEQLAAIDSPTLTSAPSQTSTKTMMPNSTNTLEQIHPKGILVYYDYKNIYSVDIENQKVKALLSVDAVLQDLTVAQGFIYFTSTTSKNNNGIHNDKEIFRMKLDGSNLEQLTTGEIGLLTGVAPNGKYLTYIGMDSNLWLLDIENNMSEKIAELKSGYDFLRFASWSPDDSELLYFQVFRSDSEGNLFLYTIEDKKTKAILPDSIISFNLTWSPLCDYNDETLVPDNLVCRAQEKRHVSRTAERQVSRRRNADRSSSQSQTSPTPSGIQAAHSARN